MDEKNMQGQDDSHMNENMDTIPEQKDCGTCNTKECDGCDMEQTEAMMDSCKKSCCNCKGGMKKKITMVIAIVVIIYLITLIA